MEGYIMSQQWQFKGPPQPLPSLSLAEQPPSPSQLYQGARHFQQASMPVPPSNQQPQWSIQAEQMASCRRCGKQLSFLNRFGFDQNTQRCRTCNTQVEQSLQRFRTAFLEATRSGTFTNTEWTALQRLAVQERLDMPEALVFIGKDVVAFVERVVAEAEVRGNITDEIERYIYHLLKMLAIPNMMALPILQRLSHSKQRMNIQRFHQAVVQADAHSNITSETISRIYNLQKALAIPDEVAQPAFQWLVSSKQRKDIHHFSQAVAQAEAKGELTDETEKDIYHLQATLAIPHQLAQPVLQRLADLKQRTNMRRFQRAMAQVEANGDVTEEAEQSILHLQKDLAIPNESAKPILRRLAYLKQLTNIRNGELPTLSTSLQLESDELCHLETPATYHKVNAKSTTYISGRLVVTSKRLHFLSATRGTTINWSNIMRVEVHRQGVSLELAKGTGNGLYAVSDPTLVGAVLNTLVKIAKRQLVKSDGENNRHIPQNVKNAVWQRDGGKCVQCGATSYLEFDHIIPYTKGGASTEGNVQLLCRSCNLKKSDRI